MTSALDRGEWSASLPGRALPLEKEPPVPTVQEAGLDTEARGKILCPCWGSNLDRPVVQSVELRILEKLGGGRYCTRFISDSYLEYEWDAWCDGLTGADPAVRSRVMFVLLPFHLACRHKEDSDSNVRGICFYKPDVQWPVKGSEPLLVCIYMCTELYDVWCSVSHKST
jgi:hypothetical protein